MMFRKLHLLPLLIAMGLFFIIPSLAENYSGTWGTAAWTIDDGILTISEGKGASQNGKLQSPWFDHKGKVTAVVCRNVQFQNDVHLLFCGLEHVTSIAFEDCNGSAVTQAHRMFEGCSALVNVSGLSCFQSASPTSLYDLFKGCRSLPSIDVSPLLGADKKELNLSGMFQDCAALQQVSFHSASDTICGYYGSKQEAREISLQNLFNGCVSLQTVHLQFSYPEGSTMTPISNLTDMFKQCSSLKSIDLSTFRPDPDSVSATSLSGLFSGCSALSKVTLSSWFPSVTLPSSDAGWYSAVAGQNCVAGRIQPGRAGVHDIYAKSESDAVFPSGTLLSGAFGDCLWTLDPFSGALIIDNMALKNAAPVSSETSPWIAYARIIRSAGFTRVGLKKENAGLLKGLVNLESVSFTNCSMSDTASVSYKSLFEGCTALKSVDLSGLPLSNVTSINRMFADCASLVSLDLPDFGSTLTNNARAEALSGCVALQSLSYGSFFSVPNTGLPMVDANGQYDWYCEETQRWYASTDAFPSYSQEAGIRHAFVKDGPTTSLSAAEITFSADGVLTEDSGGLYAVYNGNPIEPGVSVTLNGLLLDPALYEVAYENNLHTGEAVICVTGNEKRHFTGIARIENAFAIRPTPITPDMVSLPVNEFAYTGSEIRPAVTVTFGGTDLQPAGEGVGAGDFCISWRNNIDVPAAGTAEDRLPCAVLSELTGSDFTVAEEILLPFSIVPMSIGAADVAFQDMQELYGNGEAQLPSFTLLSVRPIPADSSGTYRFQPWDEAMQTGDYTVSGENNTDIGTEAYLTVTFTGNFSGSMRHRFSILAAPLDSIAAEIQADLVYTGEAQKPELILKTAIGGEPYMLQAGEDYEIVSWAHNTDAWLPGCDEAKRPSVTLTGKGVFGGTRTIPFEIRPRDLKDASVTLTDSWLSRNGEAGPLSVVYDGEAHLPAPEVKFSFPPEEEGAALCVLSVPQDALLVSCLRNNDAEEETEDAVNAGTVRVRVTAKAGGNFTGTADKQPEFQILPACLTADMIRFADGDSPVLPADYDAVFTGGAILPEICILLGEKKITPASYADPLYCNVSVENNVNAHSGAGADAPRLMIQGTGNFTTAGEPDGVLSISFAIQPRPIEKTGIGIADIADHVYTGYTQRPAVSLVGAFLCPDGKSYVFRESDADSDGDNDYTVKYENCCDAVNADGENPPTVTLSFHGNFSGTLKKAFTIRPLPLTDAFVTVSAAFPETPPVYAGRPQTPVPALSLALNGGEFPFEPGKAYSLSWENNTDAWQEGYANPKPLAIVTGMGNFSGTLAFPFTITPRSIEAAEVRLTDDWLTTDPETGNASVAYNGKPRVPKPSVTLSVPAEDEPDEYIPLLVPPEELEVSCLKNGEPVNATEVGAYTVRVAAKDRGNFTGTAADEPELRIYLLSLADCEASLAIPVPAFLETGLPKKPAVIAVKKDVGLLRQGNDFTVTYENNIEAGTATATLTSITEPGVTKTLSFRIEKPGSQKAALPASLQALEAGALAGASFREIELPASCRRIGANAFAPNSTQDEQTLLQITIPNAEAEMDAEAFGGLSAFTLRAPQGLMIGTGEAAVPAAEFCASHGIYYERIAE